MTRTPAYLTIGNDAQGATATEVLRNAGLDFEVAMEPLYTSGGKEVRSKFRRTFRNDTDMTLGVVGSRYHVLQNQELLEVPEMLTGTGEIEWDRIGMVDHGSKLWASFRLPDQVTIGDNDVLDQFVYLFNSHDGSGGVRILPVNFRLQCTNQFSAAMRGLRQAGINPSALTIRHSSKMHDRIAEWRRILNIVNHFNQHFVEQAQQLIKVEVSEADRIGYYIDTIGLKQNLDLVGENNTYGLSTRGQNTLDTLLKLEQAEQNTTGGMAGTAWGMFNVVTDYIDHDWIHNAGGEVNHRRAESAIIGPGSRMKSKAWEGAALLLA